MLYRPPHVSAVMVRQPDQHRVAPLTGSLPEQEAGQHRRQQDGEHQRPQQREGHRPRHGPEQPAFHPLQGEDRHVRRNNDDDGVKHRALDFMRRDADGLGDGAVVVVVAFQVAQDVFDHHHAAIHHHAEIERAQRKQVGGDMAQVEQDGGEEQRKRNGQGDNKRAANVAQEQKQNDDHQNDAFGQVVQHGVGGVAEQIAAVEVRNDPDAGRQHVVVDVLNFGVQRQQDGVRFRALADLHDAFHHVVVIDDLAVFAVDGLAQLSQPDLGPLGDYRHVAHAHRGPVLRLENRGSDVFHVAHQSHRAHVERLLSLLDEAAAGVHVVGGQRLLHLADAEAVGHQLVRVHAHLVLARFSAKHGHRGHVRHGHQLLQHHPVLQPLQLHQCRRADWCWPGCRSRAVRSG